MMRREKKNIFMQNQAYFLLSSPYLPSLIENSDFFLSSKNCGTMLN